MLKSILKIMAIPLSIVIFVVGCSENNPVESEEEHFEAIGLFILSGSDTIAKYQDLNVSGKIEVTENDQTDLLQLQFIEEDGHVGLPPNEEWSLVWDTADTSVAEVVSTKSQINLYQIQISGKKVGQTTIKIIINHHDHKDYESAGIPIDVIVGD